MIRRRLLIIGLNLELLLLHLIPSSIFKRLINFDEPKMSQYNVRSGRLNFELKELNGSTEL